MYHSLLITDRLSRNFSLNPAKTASLITTSAQHLQLTSSVEVHKRLLDANGHRLLTLTNPDTGIEELLVRLVLAVGVADGGHEVILLLEHVVADTGHVGELQIGVQVDLDNTVGDGLGVLGLGGAGTTVEDEVDGLVVGGARLLLDEGLVLGEELRVQLDVAGLVDTVDVTEAGGDGEVRRDGRESLVDLVDVFGLGVEGVVVDVLVVDTVFLTTGDTDFLVSRSAVVLAVVEQDATYHLEPLLHGGSALEVLGGGLDVEVDLLLGQIDHVGGEERLAVLLVVGLISVEHAVQPGQQLLGAVIGVKDDGDAVGRGDGADVLGTGNGTSDRSFLTTVGNAL